MKIISNESNQTILKFGSCEVLFSYETPVAGFNGTEWFRTEDKFSKTTTKHINKYLRERADAPWKVVPQHYVEHFADAALECLQLSKEMNRYGRVANGDS